MLDTLWTSPAVKAALIGALAALALDLDAFVTFRKEHPGASYDWLVVGVKVCKAAIVTGLAGFGYQVS